MIRILKRDFDIISLYNFLLVLLVFSLSLNRKIAPILMILSLVTAVFLRFKYKHSIFKEKYFYFYLLFFLYQLIRTLFDQENLSLGLRYVEKNLSFIVIPLIFIPELIKNIKTIYKSFIFGLILSIIILFFRISFFLLTTNNHNGIRFYYQYFSKFGFHPTYLGMYALIAIIIIDNVHLFDKSKSKMLILFFSLVIFLTASRIAMIALVLFFLYKSILNKRKFYLKIVILILFSGVFAYSFSPDFRLKITQLKNFKGFSYYDNNDYGSVSLRVAKIKAATRVWKKNKWFGVGYGQVEEQLINFYKTKSIQCWPCMKRKYNTHNEYLQILASLGNFGLFLFFLLIGYLFVDALVHKKHMLLDIIFVFLMFGLTESILERQRGITALLFFTVIAYHSSNLIKISKNE